VLVRRLLPFVLALAAAVLLSPALVGATAQHQLGPLHSVCSAGYVDAVIGGQQKCLHAGEFCSASYESDYERYGFTCVDGRLQTATSSSTTTTTAPATTTAPPTTTTTVPRPPTTTTTSTGGVAVGSTVLLKARTKRSGCKLGALPDRRCSPGAYSSGLTKAVICSSSFRTGSIRNVPTSEKHAVEAEYGLVRKSYGRTLEIDHLVSLELGGSNDIANLFPEKAILPGHQPGYRLKDKLENAAHAAVCAGQLSLRAAQRRIAANWELLYRTLFGVAPGG
jgi:hypothetical protein